MNYLTRTPNGIMMSKENEIIYLDNSIKYVINNFCKDNLCTMDGRISSVRSIFKYKSLTPVYIDTVTLLFPTASLREYSVYYINYLEILFISNHNKDTVITFKDLSILKINVNYGKISKQIKRCELIDEYINDL